MSKRIRPNLGRLIQAAFMLEDLAADKRRKRGFSLRIFFANRESSPLSYIDEVLRESDRPECGSAACAGGFCALYPPFRKRGLRLKGNNPVFQEKTGFEALRAFFGISDKVADRFFGPSAYYEKSESLTDPLLVAKRIRKYVNRVQGQRRRALEAA